VKKKKKYIIYDYLVIGAGIAGLYYAIKASKNGRVLLLAKDEVKNSNTYLAQGGIATVNSKNDSFEKHIADTISAGDELCNTKAVEMIVKDGPAVINDLIGLGINFTKEYKDKNKYDLHKEGGHSEKRVFHHTDITGKEIIRGLLEQISNNKNIDLIDDMVAIDLLTEHQKQNSKIKTKKDIEKKISCYGAYVFNVKENKVETIYAKSTILATGGSGQVYLHTSNPAVATGDGVAMAYRATASLSNLEFFQFHPTTLYTGTINSSTDKTFLISEALRGFGAELKNRDNKEFMSKYHTLKSLAPRDIVARAIDNEMKTSGNNYIYLDVTNFPASKVINSFPNIYKECLAKNIDITKEPIPVVPAAHYQCGGIQTDLNGKTNVKGLFAIGEVASTGVHGANRLASNSLLESLVFAKKAVIATQQYNKKSQINFEGFKKWQDSSLAKPEEKVIITYQKNNIKTLMSNFVGIVRNNERLLYAQKMMDLILWQVREYYKKTKISKELIELRNLADVASLTIRFAIYRKESRGLHYNTDYPKKDNLKWNKNSTIRSGGRRSKRMVNSE